VRALSTVLAGVAVGLAVFWNGGFDPWPQWTFAAVAAAAALMSLLRERRVPSMPVLFLLALAALQALSAAWTVASPSDALRAGAVTAGYAAVAYVLVGHAPRRLAAAIAAAACVAGLMGLVSAALHSTLYAERVEGAWRPEGPFGYPPALSLVQVFALPVLLAGMTRARPALAGVAAVGAATASGVLVLVANRLTLALAVLALGLAVLLARRRATAGAALALCALAGIAFHELLGGWTWRLSPGGAGTAVAAMAIVLGAAPAWLVIRRLMGDRRSSRRLALRPVLPAAAVLVAVAVVAGLLSGGALSARRFDSHEGITHGRTWMWSAASRAALDRPLQGYGAGSFLTATLTRQPGHGRVTRFAHDEPLELAVETGILGLLLALGLYAACGRELLRARGSPALWLLGPAVAAFLLSNLVDWTWHLAGVGALFAVAVAGLTRPSALRP